MRFEGKVAMVTGASSGMGRAIALAFSKEGASIAAVARREELLKSLVEEIKAQGRQALYYITGDTFNFKQNAFPHLAEMTGINGKIMKITPAPTGYGPAIPSSLIHDLYAWYDSAAKLKALAKAPEFIIPGHEPSLVGKTFS